MHTYSFHTSQYYIILIVKYAYSSQSTDVPFFYFFNFYSREDTLKRALYSVHVQYAQYAYITTVLCILASTNSQQYDSLVCIYTLCILCILQQYDVCIICSRSIVSTMHTDCTMQNIIYCIRAYTLQSMHTTRVLQQYDRSRNSYVLRVLCSTGSKVPINLRALRGPVRTEGWGRLAPLPLLKSSNPTIATKSGLIFRYVTAEQYGVRQLKGHHGGRLSKQRAFW